MTYQSSSKLGLLKSTDADRH